MKKLFFTALVAVVAVGGAFADIQLYDSEGNPLAFCKTEAEITCSEFEQGTAFQQDGETVINESEYNTLFYN